MREAPALAIPLERPVARSRPASQPKPRAPAARAREKPPSILRRAFARPGVTAAGAIFAAVMTGIVTNAVLFQKGQHPSPLFGAGATAGQPVQVPTPPRPERTAIEVPAAAPVPIQPAVDPIPVAAPAPHDNHAALAPHKAPAHSDAIGKLLTEGTGGVPHGKPVPKTTKAEVAAKPHGPGPAHAATASGVATAATRSVKKTVASAAVPAQH